jgi:hypothetical protein
MRQRGRAVAVTAQHVGIHHQRIDDGFLHGEGNGFEEGVEASPRDVTQRLVVICRGLGGRNDASFETRVGGGKREEDVARKVTAGGAGATSGPK